MVGALLGYNYEKREALAPRVVRKRLGSFESASAHHLSFFGVVGNLASQLGYNYRYEKREAL